MVCLCLNMTYDSNSEADMLTPSDITYSTPHTGEQTQGDVISPGHSTLPPAPWIPSSSSQIPQVHYLQLVWNGHTRSDIENIYREAQVLERTGKSEDAESKLREALSGLENLLTPTHEDTNKVAYHLADFYARNNRMKEADMILSRMVDAHMGQWGIEHKKTKAHLAHIADLFHRWSRTEDAITLLSRAADTHKRLLQRTTSNPTEPGRSRMEITYPGYVSHGSTRFAHPPANTPTPGSLQNDPTQIDYQIGLAKARISAKGSGDESDEEALLRLIKQCERYPERLAVQIFEGSHALVELYQTLESPGKVSKGLIDAEKVFWTVMKSDAKMTILILQAAVDLTGLHVKNARYDAADLMFEEIQSKVVEGFGIDDDVTISILINIGMIYQNQRRWVDAQPRFEQALAASMTANGLESSITQQLEEALENRCYVMSAHQCQGLTSRMGISGSHCLGWQFGCSDTSSLLNALMPSANGR
jgi:tetratricopeptide (TPR) repeat protein